MRWLRTKEREGEKEGGGERRARVGDEEGAKGTGREGRRRRVNDKERREEDGREGGRG